MTTIELLEMLTKNAKEFRSDQTYYTRNAHMHKITNKPDDDIIDAVLVGFINHIAGKQCIDYALYASDLQREA